MLSKVKKRTHSVPWSVRFLILLSLNPAINMAGDMLFKSIKKAHPFSSLCVLFYTFVLKSGH